MRERIESIARALAGTPAAASLLESEFPDDAVGVGRVHLFENILSARPARGSHRDACKLSRHEAHRG